MRYHEYDWWFRNEREGEDRNLRPLQEQIDEPDEDWIPRYLKAQRRNRSDLIIDDR